MGSSTRPSPAVPRKDSSCLRSKNQNGYGKELTRTKGAPYPHPGYRWRMLLPGKLRKKMLINNERTQYVYENKRKMDKVPDPKSDIYVEMTCL